MTVYYQKKKLNYQLISGIVISFLSISLVFLQSSSVIPAIWILFGSFQVCGWFYKKKHQYLYIDKNSLTKNSIFPKSLAVNELTAIRKYKGSFVLETKDQNLKIHKDLMEDDSLYALTDFLNKIEIKPQKAQVL